MLINLIKELVENIVKANWNDFFGPEYSGKKYYDMLDRASVMSGDKKPHFVVMIGGGVWMHVSDSYKNDPKCISFAIESKWIDDQDYDAFGTAVEKAIMEKQKSQGIKLMSDEELAEMEERFRENKGEIKPL